MWTVGAYAPPSRLFLPMYLLYLDDSGSVRNAADRHIVLAGLAVYERQPHWPTPTRYIEETSRDS
jgi:hypothetical protein